MLNVVQFGISYRFRTSPFEPAGPASNISDVLIERRLYFESNRAAVAFLRQFATNPFAVRGFHNLLSSLGLELHFHHQPEEWMDRLALSIVAGRVTVIETVPRAPAGESSERSGAPAPTSPPPRRSQPAEPPAEPVEQPTFSPADADEEAQIQTLINAAQSGTPFCEACARAAAAQAAQSKNNAQYAV